MSYETTNADRTDALLAALHLQVENLVTGDDWKAALDFQARFHTYSFNNAMLIQLQRPDATYVGGHGLWKTLGRYIRKGEKGIAILAPINFKKTDPDTGEDKYVFVGRYKTVYVFDISQTEGEPFTPPTILSPAELDGDAPVELDLAIALQITAAGYHMKRMELTDGRKGYTDPISKLVAIKADVSPLQAMKTAVHELAHILLHANQTEVNGKPFSYGTHRGLAEVEAESTAYIVCASLGLSTDEYSFAYVGGWSNGDMDLVKKTGQRVAKTATAILKQLENHDE